MYIYIFLCFSIYICLPKAFHIFMCSSCLADPLARTVERRTSNLGVLRHPRADWSRFLGSRCKIDLFSMENMVVCSYIYIYMIWKSCFDVATICSPILYSLDKNIGTSKQDKAVVTMLHRIIYMDIHCYIYWISVCASIGLKLWLLYHNYLMCFFRIIW